MFGCPNLETTEASMETHCIYLSFVCAIGMTARQLIDATEKLTKGEVSARFFHMYPPRDTGCLRKWLAGWMKKGAVPVLTLNRQTAVPPGYCMPDAWHHQMAFGAGPKGECRGAFSDWSQYQLSL